MEEDIDSRDFTFFPGLSAARIFLLEELNCDFLNAERLYPFYANTLGREGFNNLPSEVWIGVFDSLAANRENLFVFSTLSVFLAFLFLGVMFLNFDSSVCISLLGVLTLKVDDGVAISSSWWIRGENCDSFGEENLLFAFSFVSVTLLRGEFIFNENLDDRFLLSIMSWIRLEFGFFIFIRFPFFNFFYSGLMSRDCRVTWSLLSVITRFWFLPPFMNLYFNNFLGFLIFIFVGILDFDFL